MKKIVILSVVMLTLFLGCDRGQSGQREVKKGMAGADKTGAVATFAGGCFWCVESDFEKVPGVLKVVSGYTGGTGENPTYETYARQGHIEAVQVFYDPAKVSYAQLLDVFWRHIDPTDAGGSVWRPGASLPERHLLPRRGAAAAGGKIQRGTGEIREGLPNRS